MSTPQHAGDYISRDVEAARRVLIDIGQVLASFIDRVVVVGGWVPELLIKQPEKPHVGSIDVDLALDADRLNNGLYAEMLKLLLDTERYLKGNSQFQLLTSVDLQDGLPAVEVEIDFLASKDINLKKNKPKLIENFRVLQIKGCETAFRAPEPIKLSGQMIDGTENTVHLQVASVADFLILKAYALTGRDKPKDAYDICFCLQNFNGGSRPLAESWKQRKSNEHIVNAIGILKEKFASPKSYGPSRYAQFIDEEPDMDARRAYELVEKFIKEFESDESATSK